MAKHEDAMISARCRCRACVGELREASSQKEGELSEAAMISNRKDLSGSEAEIRKKSWERRYIGGRRAGAMSKTAFEDGASAYRGPRDNL